jgi:hypothetical protein
MTQPATAVEKGATPHPLGWANLTHCTIQPSNDTTNKRESKSWTLTCTVKISKNREKKRRLSFSGSQTEAHSRMKLEVESLKPTTRSKRKLNALDETLTETTTPLGARPSLSSRATSRQHGKKLTHKCAMRCRSMVESTGVPPSMEYLHGWSSCPWYILGVF